MKADNRERFLADEKAYLDEWQLSDEAKQAADKTAQDAQNAFNQADQKVKQLQPGYQKAVDVADELRRWPIG